MSKIVEYVKKSRNDAAGFETSEYADACKAAHAAAKAAAAAGNRLPDAEFWMFLSTETSRILKVRPDANETVFAAFVRSKGGNGLAAQEQVYEALHAYRKALDF